MLRNKELLAKKKCSYYLEEQDLMIDAKIVNMISKEEIMLKITRRTYGQKFLACFVSSEDPKN